MSASTAPPDTAPTGGEVHATHESPWRRNLRALVANRLALAGLVVLGATVVVAVLGDVITPYEPFAQDITARLQPPSGDHWFGTDDLGRDIFSRVLAGARVSLQVGVVAVGISTVLGVLIGLVAGYFGGWSDTVLMRFMDIMFSFPIILLAIAIIAVRGPSLTNAMIAIGIVFTPIMARVTRGSVLSVREDVHVRAVRAVGASDARILVRHVLPNIAGPIIVQASLSFAFAILTEAALSFLGAGAQRPSNAWGLMLFDARGFIQIAWWYSVFPGLAIFVTVMAFNVVGDGLRDALDPKQRSVIESRGQEVG